ncbi:MAG: YggT family protein [Candidatus Obscuribacterales bacterium]|nr:YggT family protein [Candidatus Obscuribacterales bacterium]
MQQAGALVSTLIEGYTFVIILWCLLSWFPNIRWYEQPFKTLDMLVQPFMAPFRRLIPPMGGIDLSPMIAILILQFIAQQARTYL